MNNIVIHDYAGHPFQIDLSKQLAKNGYKVTHLYTTASGGPKAGFDSEIENLSVINVQSETIAKQNFVKRRGQEKRYGQRLVHHMSQIKPDVVISANTPLDALNSLHHWCKKQNVPFIFWLQDINSIAAESILKKKLGVIGSLVAAYYKRMEKQILLGSEHVVTITEDFNPIVTNWGVNEGRITTVPNWAPIEEIPVLSKNNDFCKAQKLEEKFVVLYSGTMGMKHNPDIIYETAESLTEESGVVFLVITEGKGRTHLEARQNKKKLDNLRLLDFQPFEIFPEVLGSANCTLTLLEPEAGVFSVPSKVWSSYSAQKACLLIVPEDNLAAKITKRIDAGRVISSNNPLDLKRSILELYNSQELCKALGTNARKYAEEHFYVEEIVKKFEKIIGKLIR